ncbi:2Fe-2S iron-sulfur cluster-binding protein [Mycolicibacterium holsaticum]|uniref:2Fe-2S iron-sulfur cluster-binding protein n=1 Tax=Mycolicibacterium holsaticum TaxID=152142 RepID=UPI001C7DF530|nr:2Fe-2S iron-sulfur cluster-binding protein [Mycolicibacterium holsaticum]MDA4107081.1 ferredoxin [Mycolicibacterium holsaticum DSM 44478 = JCM 12374]QZA11299.1 2Fe-2S iron-sulfur cluster binding domain-containing protein [Mycolicibacterium holsaticum DSM 44478 = JCM 12374]
MTSQTDRSTGVRGDRVKPSAPAAPTPSRPAGKDRDQMPEVTILPDGLRVLAEPGESVLAALSRAGLRYRVGCKRGGCGVCKVQLTLGEVRYERVVADSVLSDDERVAGICLSCRAVPITNIAIELQEGDRLRKVLRFAFPDSVPPPPSGSAHDAANGIRSTPNVDTERRKGST